MFDLGLTIECGQFFRYKKADGGYFIYAGDRRLFVRQGDKPDGFWAFFFDLDRDYNVIYEKLAENDPIMQRAIDFAPGIRIMNQDPWETLVCFIISANNRIPMIKKTVENIVSIFGGGTNFPSPDVLSGASPEELNACKTGFRSKYIIDAAKKFSLLSPQFTIPTPELRKLLTTIDGVGNKVADCVMLFSMGRREVFPVDVWIGRAMQVLYGVPPKETQVFAKEKFGEYAGYANQLLFHYARMNRIV